MSTEEPFTCIDLPEGQARNLTSGDMVTGFMLALVFLIPGLIYMIWAMSKLEKARNQAKAIAKHNAIAYSITGCSVLISGLHKGVHPKLPTDQRVLLGIKPEGLLAYYSYRLDLFHEVELATVAMAIQPPKVVLSGSSYTLGPDSTIVEVVEDFAGEKVKAEIDLFPTKPAKFLESVQAFEAKQLGNGGAS